MKHTLHRPTCSWLGSKNQGRIQTLCIRAVPGSHFHLPYLSFPSILPASSFQPLSLLHFFPFHPSLFTLPSHSLSFSYLPSPNLTAFSVLRSGFSIAAKEYGTWERLKGHSGADWPVFVSRSIKSLIYNIFTYKVWTLNFYRKGQKFEVSPWLLAEPWRLRKLTQR